jgi:acyl-CoA thioester hydrolase
MNTKQYSILKMKVEFEDLDAAGIVYHVNYLNFLVRARLSYLDSIDYSYMKMLKEGVGFPVVEINQRYKKPLFYGDKINIYSKIIDVGSKTILVAQYINKENEEKSHRDADFKIENIVFEATVKLVSIDTGTGRPIDLPENIRSIFVG